MILTEKSRAPEGMPWVEQKSDEHLSSYQQQNTDICCHLTYHMQFWIMTGIFYSWDCSIFQYQTMCKSSIELGLVYKTFIKKPTWEILEAEQGYFFPHKQKHTSLETFFLSESRAVQPN